MTISFHIPDMTCGHCVRTITEAINAQYPAAKVEAQVDTHTLTVSGVADETAVANLIKEEGYSPELKQ